MLGDQHTIAHGGVQNSSRVHALHGERDRRKRALLHHSLCSTLGRYVAISRTRRAIWIISSATSQFRRCKPYSKTTSPYPPALMCLCKMAHAAYWLHKSILATQYNARASLAVQEWCGDVPGGAHRVTTLPTFMAAIAHADLACDYREVEITGRRECARCPCDPDLGVDGCRQIASQIQEE